MRTLTIRWRDVRYGFIEVSFFLLHPEYHGERDAFYPSVRVNASPKNKATSKKNFFSAGNSRQIHQTPKAQALPVVTRKRVHEILNEILGDSV
jgi:hypothetical protein